MSTNLRTLIDLQLHGVCGASFTPSRCGGAGPSGMRAVWLDGHCVMLPAGGEDEAFHATTSGDDLLLCKSSVSVRVRPVPAPRFYELATADGVPYRQIALLHGHDCLASTVVQQCARYARPEHRCRFCALGATLASGATILRKTPEQLAEVAEAAQRLDGVTHVTLTSGTAARRNAGILYLGECARAITLRTGLPVQIQFEPPEDLAIFARLKALGVANVSMHVESLDEDVRRRMTPGKASIPLDAYFAAFRAAVNVFGRNRVNTYVILVLGEDKDITLARCRELATLGVYPNLVPLRPLPGTGMADTPTPDPAGIRELYAKVSAALHGAGLSRTGCVAGCGRCGACSLLQFAESRPETARTTSPDARAARRKKASAACDFTPADVQMTVASTPEELAACHAVRQAVFVEEQGIFHTDDTDRHDAEALHILARVHGEIAGVVRCYRLHGDIWYGGRLAVLRRFRSHLGALLVQQAVETMRARPDVRRFFATIQIQNVRFFKRLNWKALGRPFLFDGCKHQLMERLLRPKDAPRVAPCHASYAPSRPVADSLSHAPAPVGIAQ